MDHLMVPEDAAAMENSVEATDESVSAGAGPLLNQLCEVPRRRWHGGDGPGAAALDPPPQNLTQGDAALRTDGELFYIISKVVALMRAGATGCISRDAEIAELARAMQGYHNNRPLFGFDKAQDGVLVPNEELLAFVLVPAT